MDELRILFTGVGRRIELLQAFRQAALSLNVNLKIYGADMTETAPALVSVSYTHLDVYKRQVLGCLGAGAYSRLILTPVYTSTAMVYVLSKETTLTSLADLQIGSQLTKDYSCLLYTSRCV